MSDPLQAERDRRASRGIVSVPQREVDADTDLRGTDYHVLADNGAGAIEITLEPAVQWAGRSLFVTRMAAGVNDVTLLPASGDTINGAASLVLGTQYESAVLMGTTQNLWLRIS